MAHDHRALRGALDSLAGAQPPAPLGRYAGIRELARRRRLRQQAMMGATSAMVAVAAVGLGVLIHRSPAAPHRPAWALSWPGHRDGSVPEAGLRQALLAWRHQPSPLHRALPAPRQVIWYLAERLDGSVTVIFEARAGGRNWLVTGSSAASRAPGSEARGRPAGAGWVFSDTPAPVQTPGLAIGLYLPGAGVGPASPGPGSPGAASPDGAFAVLAGPDTRSVSWRALTTAGNRGGTAPADRGLAVAVPGPLRGPVRLTALHTSHGTLRPDALFAGGHGDSKSGVPSQQVAFLRSPRVASHLAAPARHR
jgi:hypothetical protein